MIDFALAHAETPLADIGYGLWRSGRPRKTAITSTCHGSGTSSAATPALPRSRPTRPL